MKNGKVSLGLIGAGRAGMIHARNFRAAVPNAALTAVADPCRENVQAALQELEIEKGYEDYRELLKDEEIDAVIIVTPTKYHCEIAVGQPGRENISSVRSPWRSRWRSVRSWRMPLPDTM